MASNTRGRRGSRPLPDETEDDRLEEGATRPEMPSRPIPDSLDRQTSFAREFFNGSSSSGLDIADRELAAALAASASMHGTGVEEESDSQSWMEDARRMQEQGSGGGSGGDWNPSAASPSAGGFESDFGSRQDIIEQHRIMAVHEAHAWLKNMTGVDMDDSQKTGPLVAKIDDGYRKALLTPMLPNPRRVTVTNSSMPELKKPELPVLKRKQVQREYKTEIAPVVHPAVIMSSADEEVPVGEKPLQCLGCKKSLRVQQKALFASCPNCSAKSPAITLHRQGVSV